MMLCYLLQVYSLHWVTFLHRMGVIIVTTNLLCSVLLKRKVASFLSFTRNNHITSPPPPLRALFFKSRTWLVDLIWRNWIYSRYPTVSIPLSISRSHFCNLITWIYNHLQARMKFLQNAWWVYGVSILLLFFKKLQIKPFQ